MNNSSEISLHSFNLESAALTSTLEFCAKVSYLQSGPDVIRPGIYTEHTHRLRTSAASQEGSLPFYQCV